MILRDSSGCGYKNGFDQSGNGLLDGAGAKVAAECEHGGIELHIGHLEVNPTKPLPKPAAVPQPQNCLNDLNGSSVGTAEIQHNTIVTNEPLSLYCNRDGITNHLSEKGNFVLPSNPFPPATAAPANPN
jgi:hypothetical protein